MSLVIKRQQRAHRKCAPTIITPRRRTSLTYYKGSQRSAKLIIISPFGLSQKPRLGCLFNNKDVSSQYPVLCKARARCQKDRQQDTYYRAHDYTDHDKYLILDRHLRARSAENDTGHHARKRHDSYGRH
jgi:hypothetical protein